MLRRLLLPAAVLLSFPGWAGSLVLVSKEATPDSVISRIQVIPATNGAAAAAMPASTAQVSATPTSAPLVEKVEEGKSRVTDVRGVPEVKTPVVMVKDPVPVWEVKASDRNLRETLSRWAVGAGWQVSWEMPKDIAISAGATFVGGFEEAVGQALDSLGGSSTTAEACTYSNKVVRIVPSNLVCEVRK